MPASETICGSTHHYLVSVRGSRWKETNLVMFTVYVDDSGTRKNHKIAVATALVVPGENVPKLEAAWGDFKRAEPRWSPQNRPYVVTSKPAMWR